MADFVVDSKHGRRQLIEVPPMQPIYQREDLAHVSRTEAPSDRNSYIYPSQRRDPGIAAYDPSYYYNPPVYHRQEAIPEPDYKYYHPGRNDQRMELPEYRPGYAYDPLHRINRGFYPYSFIRPDYPVQESYSHQHHLHNPRPVSEVTPQFHPGYSELPPKPKSAHYFYGPDGELLPGPEDLHNNPEPPAKRIRHELHGDRDLQPRLGHKAQDFLVEANLRYGKIKSITVKHSSPSFKTLPEFLIDELESSYGGIPHTHVVLVAVNDNYSVYATPYAANTGTPYFDGKPYVTHSVTGEPQPHTSRSVRQSPRQ